MICINELEKHIDIELKRSVDPKVKIPEVQGYQIQHTNWPGILSVVVSFKNDKGFATALVKTDAETGLYTLLSHFDVKINEDKKK